MRFLSAIWTKQSLDDGSVLWPSGREQFSYRDKLGRRVDFDVFFSGTGRDAEHLIVASSIRTFDNGEIVPASVKQKIIDETKRFYTKRGKVASAV